MSAECTNVDAPCVLLYCRSGFEKECSAEIIQSAGALGIAGYVRTSDDSGVVTFQPYSEQDMDRIRQGLRFDRLVFARQLIFGLASDELLPAADRITPLLGRAMRLAPAFSELMLETPDTNEGKALSPFVRKFSRPFLKALEDRQLLGRPRSPRLHVLFLSATRACVGMSMPGNSSAWPMGIPRLRFPAGAPSRSTLKLDEAFQVFVGDPETDLRPGMTAVDLGAAPGGWTYQLVRRHIRTVAVDNGAMAPALLESGIVEHQRADGFRYRPPRPVDWMVCDMVEQPTRIADLMADWFARGDCRHAIVNLKLPMKKRHDMVRQCLSRVETRLREAGVRYHLQCRQLYHDRAEVTVYLTGQCQP